MLIIKELEDNELAKAYPVVSQLRTHISLDEYIKIVKSMKKDGYKIICLYENGEIISYAGFAELLNLYYGNHIWVYELVTDENKRSKGYGKLMLDYIEQYAKNNSLNCVALSSGLQREDAHRFYEKAVNYDKVSYVYKKNI